MHCQRAEYYIMHIIVKYVNKIEKLHKNKFDFSNHTAVKMGGEGVPEEGGDKSRR
jgi:hypothetical protein